VDNVLGFWISSVTISIYKSRNCERESREYVAQVLVVCNVNRNQ